MVIKHIPIRIQNVLSHPISVRKIGRIKEYIIVPRALAPRRVPKAKPLYSSKYFNIVVNVAQSMIEPAMAKGNEKVRKSRFIVGTIGDKMNSKSSKTPANKTVVRIPNL